MKLNIGCGLEYKKGFVNVDAYDNTVADHIMSVTNLEFDTQSFSHVDCIQLMEHIGAAKSIYALSEIYRVLKRGGSFRLETPDLVSSFKSFIKGDENNRKMIMNWIYGLDMPGMSHKYGFPKELLERMLFEAGFVDVKIVQLKPKSIHPSLRATCQKGDSDIHQMISQFRNTLVEKKIVNLDNQVDVIEKEELIQKLVRLTLKAVPKLEDRYLKAIVEYSAVCSPIIGRVFLDTISDTQLVSPNAIIAYSEILGNLDSLGFTDVLTYLFSEMPIKSGHQNETFDTVVKLGKQLVQKCIAGDQSAIDEIKNTASNSKAIDTM
ncbi:MAG: methyltransferase domain-containing protein, partial [Candidatus Thorarchaeota archaeon]